MLDMVSVPFQAGRAFHADYVRDRPRWCGHRGNVILTSVMDPDRSAHATVWCWPDSRTKTA